MKKLFEKGTIGNCRLKNRVVMTAMTTGNAGKNGQPTEQLVRYYEERAKGGVGLIVTEIFRVNEEHGVAIGNQLSALDVNNLPSLARMVARIHSYGTKIFAQLHHGGSTNVPAMNGGKLYAPSAIPNVSGIVPEPLTLEQIEELKQQFIMTAVMCKAADFDGVELHCAHGYLLCEFLSASSNQRTDQYGGSLENRCRLPIEILHGIKAACGADFPVMVRFSVDEYDPDHEGSITLEEGIEIAKRFEAAGADALDVSCGNYFSKYGENIEPYSYSQGWRKANSKAVKEAVKVPVIAINTIKEPEVAEQLLEEGCCDFVGVGRGHIADPAWVRKAQTGRSGEIRKCIGCLYCFETLTSAGYVRCSVNAQAGREACLAEPVNNGDGRKIAVVGGGPAGMQAASLLGRRGFDVTLYEKEAQLGGALNLADKTAPYKVKLTWLKDTLAGEVERAGVKVRLGEEATVETVAAGRPEAVFLAAGAAPVRPALPGLDGANVVQAHDVVAGKAKVSGRVVVIGAGLTGLETAKMISGEVESLAIVDMVPQLGAGMYPGIFVDIMRQLAAVSPTLLPGHKLEGVGDGVVRLTRLEDGAAVELPADWVVLAMGQKPDSAAVAAFDAAFDRVVVLGENRRVPGRIATSLSDAYIAAFAFDPEA
ncbi:MAG: FAD-dependent oxidoreductase [Clostridia bacterium]|nr:FAD-dependent oxidoreductase [Clostridia bacterium]